MIWGMVPTAVEMDHRQQFMIVSVINLHTMYTNIIIIIVRSYITCYMQGLILCIYIKQYIIELHYYNNVMIIYYCYYCDQLNTLQFQNR